MMKPITLIDVINMPIVLFSNKSKTINDTRLIHMAKNKYMPHMYMEKGDRLGYSNGILTLAIGAIVLLLIFDGQTESLIPLYTTEMR